MKIVLNYMFLYWVTNMTIAKLNKDYVFLYFDLHINNQSVISIYLYPFGRFYHYLTNYIWLF